MDFQVHTYRLSDLRTQRNVLAGLALVLLMSNLTQSILLFSRSERIIVTPPQLTQSFWVEGNQFSPHYLEQMALHYVHMILDVSEANILYQGDIVLRSVVPEAYGIFKAKLLQDQKMLKKNNVSTRFSVVECKIKSTILAVELTGDLMEYVGDKRISQGREIYQIEFENRRGRLLIKAFTVIKSDRIKEEKSDV